MKFNFLGMWVANCSLDNDPCQNYGYLGKNCSCVCPPGTAGEFCEDLLMEYTGADLSLGITL